MAVEHVKDGVRHCLKSALKTKRKASMVIYLFKIKCSYYTVCTNVCYMCLEDVIVIYTLKTNDLMIRVNTKAIY